MPTRVMVVEKRGELKLLETSEDSKGCRRKISADRYDPGSFEGRLTFAILQKDGGPSYYETIDISLTNKDEYETYQLGQSYDLTLAPVS